MSYAMERIIERFAQRSVAGEPLETAAAGPCVVIRLARDEDTALLRDLAALDSAAPIAGAALVAIVDGRPWAAYDLAEDRVIADPFAPSAAAAGLLRLRVRQLRAAQGQPRFLARRAGRQARMAARSRI